MREATTASNMSSDAASSSWYPARSSHGACWEPIITELEKDFRVLAYDTYDHGWSSNSPRQGPLVDRVAELEQFMSWLGLENPVIVGQPMGV